MALKFFVVGLTLVFITLKLTEVIAWSWLWVLSPLWIWVSVVVLLFAIFTYILANH